MVPSVEVCSMLEKDDFSDTVLVWQKVFDYQKEQYRFELQMEKDDILEYFPAPTADELLSRIKGKVTIERTPDGISVNGRKTKNLAERLARIWLKEKSKGGTK